MENFEISTRLRNILIDGGVKSLSEAAQHTKRYWETRPGCSRGSMNELKTLLAARGLSFAHYKSAAPPPSVPARDGEIYSFRNKKFSIAESGDVYFLQMGDLPFVKIGFCKRGGVKERMDSIQVGSPLTIHLLGLIVGCGREHEQCLHAQFKDDRVRGEWFRMTDAIARLIDQHKDGTQRKL